MKKNAITRESVFNAVMDAQCTAYEEIGVNSLPPPGSDKLVPMEGIVRRELLASIGYPDDESVTANIAYVLEGIDDADEENAHFAARIARRLYGLAD